MLPKIKFIVSKKEVYRELKRFSDPEYNENLIPYLKKRVASAINYINKNNHRIYRGIKSAFLNFDKHWPTIKKILHSSSEKFQDKWTKIEKPALKEIEKLFFHWKSRVLKVYFVFSIFRPYSQKDGIRMLAKRFHEQHYELSTLIHELIHQNFYDQPHRFTLAEWNAVHACIFLGGWRIAKKLKLPASENIASITENEKKYIKKLKPYFAKYIKSKKPFLEWFKETYPKARIT